MYIGLHVKYFFFVSDLMKVEFSGQVFEKYWIRNFMKIRPVGAELFHADKRTDGHRDMTKLIITFLNFTNALKITPYSTEHTVHLLQRPAD